MLNSLQISNCSFLDDESFEIICNSCKQLKCLDLSKCHVTDLAINALKDLQIIKLNISKTKVRI